LLVSGDTLHLFYAAGGADTRGRILYAYSLDGAQWYPTLTVLALWVDDQWRVRELTWQAEKPVLEAIEE